MIHPRKWAPTALTGGVLLLVGVTLGATVAEAQKQVGPKPPLGLPPVFWPADNQWSKDKEELGWLLYFDKRLSSDNTVSCASCHAPEFGWTDGQAVSTGIGKQTGGR